VITEDLPQRRSETGMIIGHHELDVAQTASLAAIC
jgi:hypothetical protein